MSRKPTGASVIAAGFAVRTVTSLARPVTAGLRDHHARMKSRPRSKFTRLTAEEFRDGLRRPEADARNGPTTRPVPVVERYDVAVPSLPRAAAFRLCDLPARRMDSRARGGT
ncbi:hypothetical protein ACWCXX_28095 [Streptomyces sp. NPDC001732]